MTQRPHRTCCCHFPSLPLSSCYFLSAAFCCLFCHLCVPLLSSPALELCACSDNLILSVRCKQPETSHNKFESCFRPYVEWVREEVRRTGKPPKVLVFLHSKKGTETLRTKLDKIFNHNDEEPDQTKITVRAAFPQSAHLQ